jgi:hypothetical protein
MVASVSVLIQEPLPGNTNYSLAGALSIVHAKHHAFIVSEIELSQITLQMCFADVVINASDAALEN